MSVIFENKTNNILDYIPMIVEAYMLRTNINPKKLYLSRALFEKLKEALSNENSKYKYITKIRYFGLWIEKLDFSSQITWILGE